MILNDGQVEIVRKHYLLNILTEAQRGKVNIKGGKQELRVRVKAYYIVPITPLPLPRFPEPALLEKKKQTNKNSKNIAYLYQGSCLHFFRSWKWFICVQIVVSR